ncbi:uncharacterized protein LOC110976755 [Acanthaster planci]|uniref:Uncharacterized protein LOC110976755 n=1 Tax=Acanthaster planci TaxID=133434 RepID=A0A8B7Y252_ACAPL|nr:uncharacterized protein LOC110976755 [Acanthaster planci]
MVPYRMRRLLPCVSVAMVFLIVGLFWNMTYGNFRWQKDVDFVTTLQEFPKNIGRIVQDNQSISPGDAASTEEEPGKLRVVIIGSGPAALGAARRLQDLDQADRTVISILEESDKPGGPASSVRDGQGFLWDAGFHVVSSHYTYFDRVLNMAVPEWNYQSRASFAFMKGYDKKRRFIRFPIEKNIHKMHKGDQQGSHRGSGESAEGDLANKSMNFDERLPQKFGVGLAAAFMRKYNRKFWTVEPRELNSAWVSEQVVVPEMAETKTKIKELDNVNTEWGDSLIFRFPKYNGTGAIWESVARQLPWRWFRFHEKVTGVDIDNKKITVETGLDVKFHRDMEYDILISTVPLDVFVSYLQSSDMSLGQMQELASHLVYTHTHIVGVGLIGRIPKTLANKSWVYFPDSDSPFYRVTMFSNFSDDHVPKPGAYWSLICEIVEPEKNLKFKPKYWSEENLIKESMRALVLYGFISADMVVSKYYRRLEHGYPLPSRERDVILDTIQPWLKRKDIYSRGRFGGWKYEVGNQDQSFMQGVEAVDDFVYDIPEMTYPYPDLVNSKKNTDRVFPLDYEIVIAHYRENLDWLRPYASHTLVYHQGNDLGPPFQVYGWERLENVGREPHAYLYHITTFYERLADITVFAQGDSLRGRCFKNPLEFLRSAKKGIPCVKVPGTYRQWGNIKFPPKYLEHFKTNPLQISNETFGQVYRNLYGHPPPSDGIESCRNGCFGVTRGQILRHPLKFYQKALAYVSKYSNQEESHYLERLWYHFFVGRDKPSNDI